MAETRHTLSFSTGNVIANSFAVFGANFVPFMALSLLVNVTVFWSLVPGSAPEVEQATGTATDPVASALSIVNMLLLYVLTAAVTYGSVQRLRGRSVGIRDCLTQGLARFGPAVGAGLLTTIVVVLGMLALIIPGMFLAVILWVAVPVAVIEGPGLIASLKRSAALTKGRRWGVFGLFVLVAIAAIAIFFLLVLILQLLPLDIGPVVLVLLEWVLTALLSAFYAVLVAVAYYALRMEKDGVDIEQIASVFD